MNTEILNQLKNSLQSGLKSKFNLDETTINSLTSSGINGLTGSLKQYVMKNGTKEIERIFFKDLHFGDSILKKEANSSLMNQISPILNNDKDLSSRVSEFSLEHLMTGLTESFGNSGNSKDLEGIAGFLGIDKNIVKMANSSAAKFLGKFF